MNNRNQKTVIFLLSSFFFLLYSHNAQAVCPVCTIAVGACVGLAQYLGIDDTITGVWIGGLIVSVSIWTISWMNKKNIRFMGRKILVFAAFYIFTVGPLYWKELIGHPFNKLWGVDKIVLGIFAGSILFVLAFNLNEFLKKKNGGKVYFPFQKVAVPVVILGISSFVFYLLTC